MTYATQADLEARFGAEEILQLADRDGSGVVDVGVIEAALADADTEIDGYLAVQYGLPLASIPDLVRHLACGIARYRLWSDRASEQVRTGYTDAIDTLSRLSRGKMRLVIAGSPAVSGSEGVAVQTADRVFTDALMAGALL